MVVTLARCRRRCPWRSAVVLTAVAACAAIVSRSARASAARAATERCYGLWLGLGGLVVLLMAAVWSLRDERPYRGVAVTG